jgi:hypothetical protein
MRQARAEKESNLFLTEGRAENEGETNIDFLGE